MTRSFHIETRRKQSDELYSKVLAATGTRPMSFRRFMVRLDGSENAAALTRERIGNKAASLARMRGLGLRVPPAFVITTDACRAFFEAGGKVPPSLMTEGRGRVAELEAAQGRARSVVATPRCSSRCVPARR